MAQIVGQGGPTIEPLADEKSSTCELRYRENASVRAESIDSDFDKTIDRLQSAKKGDYEEALFEHARQQIASHHAKFARPENKQSGLPDDTITAQFLAIAEWPKLEATFHDLAAERKEAGHSYAWYVTVALQRIHGISPQYLRDLRTRLKYGKMARESPALESLGRKGSETSSMQSVGGRSVGTFRRGPDVEQLKQQIRALAATRSL